MTIDGVRLQLRDVRFGFPTRPDFLGPVSLDIAGGTCWSIVGPNGAGKSTLLRVMAGLCSPSRGVVSLGDRSLGAMSIRDRARQLALVPQRTTSDLDLCARELVLMGRYPHRAFWMFESGEDQRIVERMMTVTETGEFSSRRMDTLSGGEAQRVHIAAALAQEPAVLLLDEPTSSLDLKHQLGIHALLRRCAEEDGLAVVVVTHDVNLALRFSSHVLVLCDGHASAAGPPDQVLTPQQLTRVFGVDMVAVGDPATSSRWLAPLSPGSESCAS